MVIKDENIKLNSNPDVILHIYDSGFALYVDGRWIVDGSCFTEDKKINLCSERLLPTANNRWETQKSFRFCPDRKDKKNTKKWAKIIKEV